MVNKDPFLKQAMEELGHLKEDPDFERILESRADWLRDQYSYCKQAEREGTKKGLEKGMEQGIKQGSRQEKEEIAKKLLEMKMNLKKIMKITGLTEKEIKKIK